MELVGILVSLCGLIWFAYRGWSVLLLAPAAALLAALFAREPILAHWTITFMGGASRFVAQFFPIFLLGALFGKLMDDSGSVSAIAKFMAEKLGPRRAILSVVLAGAFVTYGGVSLFVAFFVLAPMALELFHKAGTPRRLAPAAIALGTSTFTMSALPGTPSIQNAIPMPFFGTTAFAAPGLGGIASLIMLGFGLWWLARVEASARRQGEGYGAEPSVMIDVTQDQAIRERAAVAREFDLAEIPHGHRADAPNVLAAALPLIVVVAVNLTMSQLVLPRMDDSLSCGGTLGTHDAPGRQRRLVGHRGARGGHRHSHSAALATPQRDPRKRRRRRHRIGAAAAQRREPGRIRRRCRCLARLRFGANMGAHD